MDGTDTLFNLHGKLALVTGASRGLGRAIAMGLSGRGARLALMARSDDDLQEVCSKAPGAAAAFPVDLSSTQDVREAYRAVRDSVGPPDILVNCAGTTVRGPAVDLCLADWQRVMTVNLESALLLSQLLAKDLISGKRGGKILNICSLLSGRARPTIPAYTVSKTGLLGLTRSLAVEWMKHGIAVNAIGPGYFETEMTAPLKSRTEFDHWVCERVPAGRWGQPRDIVGSAIFFCSPASDFVTGQILYVDGGWMAAL